jgi:hypothetical protein
MLAARYYQAACLFSNIHSAYQNSPHPLPTKQVFVKSSWHVADPYTQRYSRWALQHLLGDAGTGGSFNEPLYRWLGQ